MIFLLRHAEGTGQEPDAPLSQFGEANARALVPRLVTLGIVSVWSSPYARARQTVAPFADTAGLTIRTDDRLCERHHGDVPHDAFDEEVRQLFADPEARPWNGESRSDVTRRALEVVGEMSDEKGSVLVGCHGFWLSCLLAHHGRPATEAAWRTIPRPALFGVGETLTEIALP